MSRDVINPYESFDRRTQDALTELMSLIRSKYPDAEFDVSPGHDDPENIHLITTVDLDDPGDVSDLVADRLIELQVEARIPVYVIPVRPPARILAELRAKAAGN